MQLFKQMSQGGSFTAQDISPPKYSPLARNLSSDLRARGWQPEAAFKDFS